MHKSTLRELAKFASGLIAADFLGGLWLYFGGLAPVSFFGVVFMPEQIILWLVFDAVFFAFLVHYAWRMEDHPRTHSERSFHTLVGAVFTIVALLHLSRIIFGWQITLGSWPVPYWLNGLGAVVAGFLAYISLHLGSKR